MGNTVLYPSPGSLRSDVRGQRSVRSDVRGRLEVTSEGMGPKDLNLYSIIIIY